MRLLEALTEEIKFSMDTPWKKLSAKAKDAVLNGFEYEVTVKYKNRYGRVRNYSTGFEGVIPFIHRKHDETDSDYSREKYQSYMRETPCPVCKGARLKPEVLAVTIGDKSIAEVCELSIDECAAFPNGDHDDYLDSTVQAVMRYRQANFIRLKDDYEDEKKEKPRRIYY
jgi:excinuclease ABC subunit A